MDQQLLDAINQSNELLTQLNTHLDSIEKMAFAGCLVIIFALGFHKGGQR